MQEPRIRARVYAGKRRKLEGNGAVGMGGTLCPTLQIGLGLGGKERQHKTHRTTQMNNITTMAHTHTHTHTHDKHTRNRTRYNDMQIYMKILIISK